MQSRSRVLIVPGATCAAMLLLGLSGCASQKNIKKDLPPTIQSTVTAQPAAPDKIDYIDLRPWSVEQGGSVDVTAGGTAGRSGKVVIVGTGGHDDRIGSELKEGNPGQYSSRVSIDKDLPPGNYRVEVTLAGGPSGQPTTLVSSRALVVTAPAPPPPSACEVARDLFATSAVAHFAFNRDEVDAASNASIGDAVSKLKGAASLISRITVEGHCDSRGTTEYNLDLGNRRAQRVQQMLAAQLGGISIEKISYGEERLLVKDAKTEEEHAQNRRAMLLVECK